MATSGNNARGVRLMISARLGAVLVFGLGIGCFSGWAAAAEPSSSTSGVSQSMPHAAFAMPTSRPFGRLPDGREVHLYTLEVPGGWKATITDYGAILTSLQVPDKDGKLVDVVLGFDTLDGYAATHPYFGAICGRVANRIAAGRFDVDGKSHQLATNNGPNHLHGGLVGFDRCPPTAFPTLLLGSPWPRMECPD